MKAMPFPHKRPSRAWRLIAPLALPVALTGCAMPLSVRLASYAVDAITYLATEKSTTDHGLSLVMNQDCALLRAIKTDSVCVEYQDEGRIVVAALPPPLETQPLAQAESEDAGADLAAVVTAAGGDPSIRVTTTANIATAAPVPLSPYAALLTADASVPAPENRPDHFLVLGSFLDAGNVEQTARRYADLAPMVMAMEVKGQTLQRVLIGPFDEKKAESLRAKIASDGLAPWPVRFDSWSVLLDPIKKLPVFEPGVTPRLAQNARGAV